MSKYEATLKKNCRVLDAMLYLTGYLARPSGGYNMFYMCLVAAFNFRSTVLSAHSIYLAFPEHIDTAVYDSVPLLCTYLAVMKFINFVVYRYDFASLRRTMAERFWAANEASPPEEQEVILRYSRYVHLVCVLQAVNISLVGILWLCKPLLEMYVLRRPDEPFQRSLPLQPWWSNDIDPYEYPMYPIEFAMQSLQTCSTAVSTMGLFCLYVFMVLHTCAQFKVLQMRVKNFSITAKGFKTTVEEQEKKLRCCLQVHQELLDFCSTMKSMFSMPLFFECGSIILLICISGFAFKMFPGNLSVYSFCIACTTAATHVTFVTCFVANLLTTESLNVAFSAYDSAWYEVPVHLQKEVMFMIARSQEAAYLTAGGFTNLSLETFESIMRTAVSYLTVLNTMNSNA